MAGKLTLAAGTNLTSRALDATSATVGIVGLNIYTFAIAFGESILTGKLALTAGANLTRDTGLTAFTTMQQI